MIRAWIGLALLSASWLLGVGYYYAPYTDKHGERNQENVLTLGAGWVTKEGALSVAGERSLNRPKNWSFVGSIQFFL